MRVAIFCNDFWPTIGGVQTAVRGLAGALARRGHAPMVLTRQPGGAVPAETVDGIPVRRFEWTLRPRLTFPLRAWRAARAVRRAVLGAGVDAVYVHFVSAHALYAWDCARRAGVPLIVSFRGNDALRIAPRSPASRAVYARLTAAAEATLFCSEWLRGATEGAPWLRTPRERTGVLADAVAIAPRTPGPAPAGAYVLAWGRLVRKKGFDLLLRAWAAVGDRVPVPLWLAGDGEERGALERLARDLGLGGRVRFLGAVPHPELLGLVECAALCVVPSREEPYGIAVLEAQALRICCLRVGQAATMSAADILPIAAPIGRARARMDSVRHSEIFYLSGDAFGLLSVSLARPRRRWDNRFRRHGGRVGGDGAIHSRDHRGRLGDRCRARIPAALPLHRRDPDHRRDGVAPIAPRGAGGARRSAGPFCGPPGWRAAVGLHAQLLEARQIREELLRTPFRSTSIPHAGCPCPIDCASPAACRRAASTKACGTCRSAPAARWRRSASSRRP